MDYTSCNLKKYFDIEVTHAEERRADTKSAFMGDVCRTLDGDYFDLHELW